jgi:transposase
LEEKLEVSMSLKITPQTDVPVETVRVAKAAFPKGNEYTILRDELGSIFTDEHFAELYPSRGQPGMTPWRLALVTVLQFMENLSDRQAANAVRARIDWKYLLGLELTDKGFHYSVLSEFRDRLLAGEAEQKLFDEILHQLQEKGLLKIAQQRTDSTHILAAVRSLNRLETVGETLRAALNSLAALAPEWLREQVKPDWFDRYGTRMAAYRLPKKKTEQRKLAETMGQDGFDLLAAIDAPHSADWMQEVPAVRNLRQVWEHQFEYAEDGEVCWRKASEGPPASERTNSPYDIEAKYSVKGATRWLGYKVHLTETCLSEEMHLITNVETTAATIQDVEVTENIHQALAKKGLLPKEHYVDTGYVDAHLLLESPKTYGVSLIGPVQEDTSWQALAGQGYALSQFVIDWQAQTATCPQGKISEKWQPYTETTKGDVIFVAFSRQDCHQCVTRTQCTRSKQGPRSLKLSPQANHEILQTSRKEQKTKSWQERYKIRSGVEGAISQGVRISGLRQSRYIGLAKTHLQHIAMAAAINLVRTARWLQGIPHAQTRCSPFAALAPP